MSFRGKSNRHALVEVFGLYILGINAYHGDAAAAIVKDAQLIAAVEEEAIPVPQFLTQIGNRNLV